MIPQAGAVKPPKSLVEVFLQSSSERMREVVRISNRVAQTQIPILIVGEPGTGKELMALALHQRSLRCDEPFLKIDCQLSPQTVIQSQMAHLLAKLPIAKPGPASGDSLIELGDGVPGTLFFHEIAELSPELQAKALALIANAGNDGPTAPDPVPSMPRVVASTTQNLPNEVAQGRFRSDLYFSIGGVVLELPALRDRKEDLAALAEHFLRKYSREFSRGYEPRLATQALEMLAKHEWPGNLTELSSVMKRSALLGSAEGVVSELAGLPGASIWLGKRTDHDGAPADLKALAKEAAQRVEREMILEVLRERQWNRKRAAMALKISYKTLLSKIKHLQLTDKV